tara:strand:+ start:478 stop:966 length:489 start_codon:yes stop_codon:yes gene_type:complete
MKKQIGFRGWYYFRQGWSLYFAFILAAINTLTVTYFLAIDNYPSLKTIFPSFESYIILVVVIGIPLLITIGYVHFKRSEAYRSEAFVNYEANPLHQRFIVNTEYSLKLNLEMTQLLLHILQKHNIDKNDEEKILTLQKQIKQLVDERTFSNRMDLEHFKKLY